MDNKVMHARYRRARDFRVGRVALCRKGKVGVILAREEDSYGMPVYKGLRPDGRPWQSRMPTLMAAEDAEFLLRYRFDKSVLERLKDLAK